MDDDVSSDGVLHILIAPDSFKGSMEAAEVARHLSAGVRRALPLACIHTLPIADGGEGTAGVIATALRGVWDQYTVTDGNGAPRAVSVAVCESSAMGRFAVFDVAQIVGLPDAVVAPEQRITRGIGELIRQLHAQGLSTIVIGLGGSSTMDAGAGLLAELAYDFVDGIGKTIHPTFDNLQDVTSIKRRSDANWLASMRLIGLTDVTSPLAGPNGASMIFGRQKGFQNLVGADSKLACFAAGFHHTFSDLSPDIASMPGTGAAGGIGFGLAILGAQLHAGAAFICATTGLSTQITQYDWVITGEGRSDRQTLMGKGPATIAALARAHAVPVSLVSGGIEVCDELDEAFDGCFSIVSGPQSLEFSMANTAILLEQAGFRVAKLFAART